VGVLGPVLGPDLSTSILLVQRLGIAEVLKRRMGASARKVPTRELPNWLLRLAALRDPAAKQILPELEASRRGDSRPGCESDNVDYGN
jgi:hypothetical protein